MDIPEDQRALSLKQVAELLGVSYATVYEHRYEMGFFQIGSAWRIWPDRLREYTDSKGRRPAEKPVEPPPATPAHQPTSASRYRASMTAKQASAELDRLLAMPAKAKGKKSKAR